ncbi:NtaA/DmoA family FMN-dependent monooxygenase [Embleya scabrispora]|uniref:NtaA/DmoA family FMN-dependent monooxygenase n=1 Tax=Embleya scabrispora TaxID=159449 RepID=UPI00099ED759|nr:NtaA/DmoA family FMN-dependent monooxygenase [Embleya scabrispora]MYS81857.1 NtaA/DmoA family FMN-dependent monooxygenase [Streptomyces sp. SID5474]
MPQPNSPRPNNSQPNSPQPNSPHTKSPYRPRSPGHPTRRIHLAAHFPGVNSTTVWSDPRSGSQIDFDSFEHLARTAERGRFDFFFLAEGQRLREHHGRIFELDVAGRPDALTVLAALAAITDRIGLAATATATYNEPYELARKIASLDHLSAGRAAWNVVTSPDAWTGENFRRGGFLPREERYERAIEFVEAARTLWDSWAPDAHVADAEGGVFAAPGAGRFDYHGRHFAIDGRFTVPRGPQGRPVLIQAGDSTDGREFGAAHADVIFSRHGEYEAGRAFYADMKGRAARHGRSPDELKILPAVTAVIGATAEQAQEKAAWIRRQQVSPQNAIQFLEQVWGRDLSDLDPDGPLPDFDPITDGTSIARGRVRTGGDPLELARSWRELAAAKGGLSLREVVIEVAARQTFIGTAEHVADRMEVHVRDGASDGFILVPHLTPTGLDEFVDQVVPILQERGVFRSEYEGTTLREHLHLPAPRPAGTHRTDVAV